MVTIARKFNDAYRLELIRQKSCEPKRVAMHEAGHGVIDVALGNKLGKIWLTEEGGGFAATEPLADIERRVGSIRQAARRYCISTMAGGLVYMPGRVAGGMSQGDKALFNAATKTAGMSDADIAQIQRDVIRLIQRHYDEIYRVASALQGSRTLTGEQVAEIAGLEYTTLNALAWCERFGHHEDVEDGYYHA